MELFEVRVRDQAASGSDRRQYTAFNTAAFSVHSN
jgi:hypothetical protein